MPTDLEDSDVMPDPPRKSNVNHVEICRALEDHSDIEAGWYFNAVAANGEIVSTSELYTSKADAKRGAEGVFPGVQQHDEGGEEDGAS